MANNNNNTDEIRHVLVRRLSEEAVFPSGFILTSAKTMTIQNWWDSYFKNRTELEVPTDLMLIVPEGVCFRIVAKPEISQKGFAVVEKVVDPRTEVLLMVEVRNLTSSDIEIKAGDQIARLESMFIGITPELVDVSTQDELANNRTLGTFYNSRM